MLVPSQPAVASVHAAAPSELAAQSKGSLTFTAT